MYRKIFFYNLVFVLACIQSMHAKSLTDSLRISHLDKILGSQKLVSPVFSTGETDMGQGKLDLFYQYHQGDLRKAQEAFNVKKTAFYAEGFRHLGKFRVAATFQFNKIFEDSLANGQRNNLDEFSTFYPYANKSGQYERQNYAAQTSVKYVFLPNWSANVNLDYLSHWSAGKDDPRLKSDVFVFKLSPGLQFQKSKTTIGMQTIVGKGDEEASLRYKNREYNTSLLYPDRIHYMNYGYGSSIIKDSSRVFRQQEFIGGRLEYQWKSTVQHWRVSTEYQYSFENNYNQSRSSAQNQGPIGTMLNNTYRFFMGWHQDLPTSKHLAQFNFHHRTGFDGNIKTSGSLDILNYEFRHLESTLQYGYQTRENNGNWTIGGIIQSYEEERKDHQHSIHLTTRNVKLTLPVELQFKQNEAEWLFSLQPNFQTNLHHNLRFNPLSLTEFIRNVVFVDSYYHQLTRFGTQIQVEWIRWPLANQKIGFFLTGDWNHALKPAINPQYDTTRIPYGNRWSVQTGIRMYIGQPL